ncbi:hypothetical protein Pan216_33460 [Planctomycetes bacterium Pan216]|uniref:Uncharacterized protein n=1 Tax=Kolteria novifilia TaxID=2527975 RepID=A0A518B681_9BACT|nr:hypothetical protein Pan216_33460 [Planctomycetes bacterium Pan216]
MSGALSTLTILLGLSAVPSGDFGFQKVPPQVFDSEKKKVPDIWVLEFTFRNPRYIMVDVPGKGRKLVWYMTYKIVNREKKPIQLIPQFELVTNDGKSFHDVIMPVAEELVVKREFPTLRLQEDNGRNKIHNSVTISAAPIPPTPAESAPLVRRGVVFWEGVDMKAKSFTVFVTGLSNGYVKVEDPKTGKTEVRRKTLELNFTKPGDIYHPNHKEIKFVGDPKWVYR